MTTTEKIESFKSFKTECIALVAKVNEYKQSILDFKILTLEMDKIMKGPYNDPKWEYATFLTIDADLSKRHLMELEYILEIEDIWNRLIANIREKMVEKLFDFGIESYKKNNTTTFYVDPIMDINVNNQPDDDRIHVSGVIKVVA